MKQITTQLKNFFEEVGCTQAELARTSGVPASTICLLLKGKRKNVIGPNQDALRDAMSVLRQKAFSDGVTDFNFNSDSPDKGTIKR